MSLLPYASILGLSPPMSQDHRRERERRVDAGDETAKLKFTRHTCRMRPCRMRAHAARHPASRFEPCVPLRSTARPTPPPTRQAAAALIVQLTCPTPTPPPEKRRESESLRRRRRIRSRERGQDKGKGSVSGGKGALFAIHRMIP